VYQPARQPASLRPANLNPYAINYNDCKANLQLTFDLLVQYFAGTSDTLQVWASLGDRGCDQDTARMGTSVACWPVLANPVVPTGASITLPAINAWDVIGQSPSSTYSQQTDAACTSQSDFTHRQFFLYFLPITSNGLFDTNGAFYKYQLDVALVGPPSPMLQPTGVGDTFLVANWVPNSDTETIGYDVFLDQFPATATPGAMVSSTSCGDAGTATSPDASSSADAAGSGGSSTGNACFDPSLWGAIYPSSATGDGGPGDASAEGGTTSETGTGGIATFSKSGDPLNASAGMTVTGESVGTYNITGLRNCAPYALVVSAVDAYGNKGPPSQPQSCAYPQASGDFWKAYRGAGGQAGGFCALETVGASPHSIAALALMAGGVAVAASRRRRRAR
jgi:hypothetical protein